MKAFVEFGHETSYTESSSHAGLKMVPYAYWLVLILSAYFVIRL